MTVIAAVERAAAAACRCSMVQLGLTGTRLVGDVGALFDTLRADYGLPSGAPLNQIDEHAQPERIPGLAVCTPARTNRSTPRESTKLLELLWTDRAAPADACARARVVLGRQVWPHRLTSGFPEDTIRVSGKTGTMFIVRNASAPDAQPSTARQGAH
jgi:beta-lactamase class A